MQNPFEALAQLIFGQQQTGPDPIVRPAPTSMPNTDDGSGVPMTRGETGSITGLLGRFMGQPSVDELKIGEARRVSQAAERARAATLSRENASLLASQELATEYQSALANNNGDQNAALRQVMQSKAFINAFARGQMDPLLKMIGSARAATAPDAPLVIQTPQGGRTELRDPQNPMAPGQVLENPREAAPDRAIQSQRAEALRKITDDGRAAQAELSTLGQLRTTLDRVGQDFPNGTWHGLAAQYGINVGPRTTDLQVANALIDRLVPSARQGLPGAASDRDVQMFRNSLPSLLRTADGNRQILETLEALATSRVESARIAGSAFGNNADPARVWTELQSMRPPMEALEERRNARLTQTEGIDFGRVPIMTRPQLKQFTNELVQHYGGAQNIPPRVNAIIRRRAAQIDEAGR